MPSFTKYHRPLLVAALITGLSGCATEEWVRGYVSEQIKPVNSRIDGQDQRVGGVEADLKSAHAGVGSLGQRLGSMEATLKEHDARLAELSQTARDALDRAIAAGKLAEGRLLYETVMSDTSLKFPVGKSVLTEEAKTALTQFANDLKAKNQGVYIEIQGHTDSLGPDALNEHLGLARAEAVRRYLALNGGIPLHRMSAVSYGETAPMADNKTRQGRMDNRRVVLVVLH